MKKILLFILTMILSLSFVSCNNQDDLTSLTSELQSTTTQETDLYNPYYDELSQRIDDMNLLSNDLLTIHMTTSTITNIQEFNTQTFHSIIQVDNVNHTLYSEVDGQDTFMSTRSYLSVIDGEYTYHIAVDEDRTLYTNNLGDYQTPDETILDYYNNDMLTNFFLFEDILVTKITDSLYMTSIPMNKIVYDYTYLLRINLPDLSFVQAEFEGLYLTISYRFVNEYELEVDFNFDTIAYDDYGLNVTMKLDINQVYSVNPSAQKILIDTANLIIMPSSVIDEDNFCFYGSIDHDLGLTFNQKTSYFKVYLESGVYTLDLTGDYLSYVDFVLLDSNYFDFTSSMNFEVVDEGYYYLKFVNNYTTELVIHTVLNKE